MQPACLLVLLLLVPSIGCDTWLPVCPLACACSVKPQSYFFSTPARTVDCSNSGLTTIPLNISTETEALILARNRIRPVRLSTLHGFTNLTMLDLSSNHIYTLQDLGLQIVTLRYLAADRNEIDYLHNRTFSGVPQLKSLSISHNKIEIIHNNALCGLRSLTHLDLSYNRIFAVSRSWFRELSSLEVLDLGDNNVHVLRDGAFLHLGRLQKLVLSRNRVKHIYDEAFLGLENLQHLFMDNNHLHVIPTKPWQLFTAIETISLSKNHIATLQTGCLQNVNVSVLQLNEMGSLRMVDRQALVGFPSLTTLELSDNRALVYLDREAFVRMPKLHTVTLQNTNLSAIEGDLIASLPAIKELRLRGNPLLCDCNARWMLEQAADSSRNISGLFPADEVVCAGPDKLKGVNLSSDKVQAIPRTCAPRIMSLFQLDYSTVLGETVVMHCRAVGIPHPQIDWLLPSHLQGQISDDVTVLKSGSMDDPSGRVSVTQAGSLYIDYIQGTDHGQYKCLASNPKGRDERTSHLHIKNMHANVIIMHVTSTAITFTWRSMHYAHDYQIMYKESNSNHTYRTIDILPYMRSYTASQLLPRTLYEFCIAVKHKDVSMPINCTQIHTREISATPLGIFNARNYIIGGAIGCLVTLVILVYGLMYVVKRYNKRKRQREELYGDNLSQLFLASIDSMSDTTPITYENRAAVIFDDDDIDEIRSSAGCVSDGVP